MEILSILSILTKSLAAGIAGVGFAVLFNVPQRTLLPIGFLSALGGLVKFGLMYMNVGIVFTSFLAAIVIGVVSIRMAHSKDSPPLVFYIPSVIPLVPGFFIYRMILGLMSLVSETNDEIFLQNLIATVSNGTKAIFILISLGIGVAVPMLISRRESIKKK